MPAAEVKRLVKTTNTSGNALMFAALICIPEPCCTYRGYLSCVFTGHTRVSQACKTTFLEVSASRFRFASLGRVRYNLLLWQGASLLRFKVPQYASPTHQL